MHISFHRDHFRKFASIDGQTPWVASRIPRRWALSVGAGPENYLALPDEKVDRTRIKNICKNSDFSDEQCFLAIMAWGGMNIKYGRAAWGVRDRWVGIVRSLRDGELTRGQAYDQFREFRADNRGCGIGPAFYTKVIFFCSPRHDGYIMDQWTALSINMLTSLGTSDTIAMASGISRGNLYHWVTDKNTAKDYELFCRIIEQISEKLGLSPETVEERLFSWGGHNPGEWRSYVKNWSQSHRNRQQR